MNLEQYKNKNVSILFDDGEILTGLVTSFETYDDDYEGTPDVGIILSSNQMGEVAIEQHEIKEIKEI